MSSQDSNNHPKGNRAVSVREACWRTGLGRNSLYSQINSGQIKTLKVGRRRLIPESEIDAFLGRAS